MHKPFPSRQHRTALRIFICEFLLNGMLACTHLRDKTRPVILLLEDAESEWVNLPTSARETFTEHVRIQKVSSDEIVNNPHVLESVIGFLVADLSSFEPIRYLSSDPFEKADSDVPLHLFRRKTLYDNSSENFRSLFTHLTSLSPRIGWSPSPSRAEKFEKRLNELRLEKILNETQIGDFQPASDGFFDILNSLEIIARSAGADFDYPIFVVPEQFHLRVLNNWGGSKRYNLTLPPETTLLEALRTYTDVYGMYYYMQDGQVIITPIHSPSPETRTYRINPDRLMGWADWTLNKLRIDQSVPDYRSVGYEKELIRRQSEKMGEKLPESSTSTIVLDPFIFSGNPSKLLSPEAHIDDKLWSFFLHVGGASGSRNIRWEASDQLSLDLHNIDLHHIENLLYRIQITPPGQ